MLLGALKLKLQLVCGDGYALGPGKADLLDAIAREGSISGAGRALGMSYRRAWVLVDEMNRCFTERLVDTAPGGGKGGGARLTERGRAMLAAYRDLEGAAAQLAEHPSYATLMTALREEPSTTA
ncbi:molybdate transport system regulatory protein [Sphingomonas guangdongensis]|uniref:Molybdate transport system regulatory protein n=1 Tax=Sphingomonas guangdongensis TaxID=1141890 RepID=A0A285R2N4_9SPHN|nr:LysR family transcriptional regulator [Sphingomonas guangdongensis]SOB88351.1 molybdate transport system regulatory protein [Sphingomonas guangdongensis]